MRLLDLEAKSPLYSHFIESLSGLVTIRAFDWGAHFQVSSSTLPEISKPGSGCALTIQGTKSCPTGCFPEAILPTILHPALVGPDFGLAGYTYGCHPNGSRGQTCKPSPTNQDVNTTQC